MVNQVPSHQKLFFFKTEKETCGMVELGVETWFICSDLFYLVWLLQYRVNSRYLDGLANEHNFWLARRFHVV